MERVKILLFLSCAAVVLTSVAGQCPRIITRASWGARSANTAILPVRPAPLAIIHHTAGAACSTQGKWDMISSAESKSWNYFQIAACSQQMRNIQSLHIDNNRWADIGYNFCVGGDGQVYEGRGWNRQGAHASGFNDRSVGICFIGTFTNSLPTAAAR